MASQLTTEEQARIESELNALRKDRDDGADPTIRYGTTRTGRTAHVLVGRVGLATECGATAHLCLPTRDVLTVCRNCESRRPVSLYTAFLNATIDTIPATYPDVAHTLAHLEPRPNGNSTITVMKYHGIADLPNSIIAGPFTPTADTFDKTLADNGWDRIGPWQDADGITFARVERT